MNFFRKIIVVLLLAVMSALNVPAQTGGTTTAPAPQENETPQWLKDLRRWEIVLFGSFPFSLFTATFAMDMHRWRVANGLDFSDTGRRYAPWPLKSSGAIAMSSEDQKNTIWIAIGLSAGVAVADQVIVQVRRRNARRRAESIPVGTTIITRTPLLTEPDDDEEDLEPEE